MAAKIGGHFSETFIAPVESLMFRSILIIQTKFIGDVVLTSSFVRNMRLAHPEAKITMLCASNVRNFVIAQRIADDAIGFDSRVKGKPLRERIAEMRRLVRDLRLRRFDVTIDLTDTKTTRLIHRLIGAPRRVGYQPSEKPLKFWERQPANIFASTYGRWGSHYLYRYLSPLDALGIDVVDATPLLEPTPRGREEAAGILTEQKLSSGAFMAVHAGARFEGRCWQPERFAAVIDEIYAATGLRSLLIGAPDELQISQRIAESATSPMANAVGNASLETLVAILAQAVVFFGNESGPMHMAASVKVPVVGLYGLTPPEVWSPFGVANLTIQPSMPCPCIAPDLCDPDVAGGVYCVQRLSTSEVASELLSFIKSTVPALGVTEGGVPG